MLNSPAVNSNLRESSRDASACRGLVNDAGKLVSVSDSVLTNASVQLPTLKSATKHHHVTYKTERKEEMNIF